MKIYVEICKVAEIEVSDAELEEVVRKGVVQYLTKIAEKLEEDAFEYDELGFSFTSEDGERLN